VVEGSFPYIPTSNTIATRLPVPLRLTPANVGTVTEPLLREQHARVLGDALNNVSGVNVQTVSGVTDYFAIRGFDSLTSGLVLTDGASEPEATFYQMYNVERVEVLKGPGGFLYGSNPLAGAVNIVRRQPVPGNFTVLNSSVGSFGTAEGTLDLNLAPPSHESLNLRLNALWRQSDSYRDDKANETLSINPAFTWSLGERSTLNLNLEYVDADFRSDSGLPIVDGSIADVPRTRSYQSPFDDSNQEIGRLQVDFQTRISEAWSLRNKTYFRGLDWNSNGTLFNGVFPSPSTGRPEVSRSLVLLDDRQDFAGNQFEAVFSGATGGVSHDLLAGIEIARFGDEYTLDVAALPGIDLLDPVETATRPFFLIPGQSSAGDSRSVVVAPYLIDQIRFSERFHVLLGARLDSIDFEDRPSATERRDRELSPMAGVVFAPGEKLTFYANAGQAFAPPSNRVAGERRPETSKEYELGTKIEALGGRVLTTVAIYRLERQNIAIPDDNGFTQQAGDQSSRGFELEFAAEPRPRLRAFLSYGFNDAELTRFTECVPAFFDPTTGQCLGAIENRSGNSPAFAPRHLVNLWISQRFANGFGFGGGGRYVSTQFITEDNSFTVDDYVVLDAALFYRFGRWDLSLNFKNLTDRDYETRGFGSTSVIPGAPFSVYAGVQYAF
jgi:TonB-dependent siderophore receptor